MEVVTLDSDELSQDLFSDSNDADAAHNPTDDECLESDSQSHFIPPASKKIYDRAYKKFKNYLTVKKIKTISENIMIGYFQMLAGPAHAMAPGSLWSIYSMLKATLLVYESIQIEKYLNLSRFLSGHQKTSDHIRKKPKMFTDKQIAKFIKTAPDEIYLPEKVALIIGIHGLTKRKEMYNLTLDYIEDHITCLNFVLDRTKYKKCRDFSLRGEFCDIVKKYLHLRPCNFKERKLFIRYQNGVCHRSVMGIHTIGYAPKTIATYLDLPQPEHYTGTSFRRSEAADILSLLKLRNYESPATVNDSVDSRQAEKDEIPAEISKTIASTSTSAEDSPNDPYRFLIKIESTSPSADHKERNLEETLMSSSIECVICRERRNKNPILFTEQSLEQCRKVLHIRKNNGLRFKDIILPLTLSRTSGYHANCYEDFNLLSHSYSGVANSMTEEMSATLEASSSSENTYDENHQVLVKIEPTSPSADYQEENLEAAGTSSAIVCVICGEHSHENPMLFTEKSLQKCNEVLIIRKNHKLKFGDIILPSSVSATDGYHDKCYKKFTALMASYRKKIKAITRSQSCKSRFSTSVENTHKKHLKLPIQIKSSLANCRNTAAICFFCEKTQKTCEGVVENLCIGNKQSLEAVVEQYSIATDDPDILERLETSLTAEIPYHDSCKTAYHDTAKEPVGPPEIDWHVKRNLHRAAYSEVSKFVGENVIKKGQCYSLNFLCYYYLDALRRIGRERLDIYRGMSTARHLKVKMLNNFGNQIKIVSVYQKEVIVPRKYKVFDDEAVSQLEQEEILHKAALILRTRILALGKQGLSGTASANSQKNFPIPEKLNDFYVSLVGGSDGERRDSHSCKRVAESLSQNVIHAISAGEIDNAKYTTFELPPRSRGNSREHDYCSSSFVKEELEIESEYRSITEPNVCFPEADLLPNAVAQVEIDDSSGLVKTENSNNSSYDTIEFIYEVVEDTDDDGTDGSMEEPGMTNGIKRKSDGDDETDEFEETFSKIRKSSSIHFQNN